MFTDDAVTPIRLEILVDLLRAYPAGLARKDVSRLLQPKSLEPDPKLAPATATIKAGLELRLIEEVGGKLSLSDSNRKDSTARDAILGAFDEFVFCSVEVEKYFALFYAYYLGLGKLAYGMQNRSREAWAIEFNRVVFDDVPQVNRFNEPKYKGLDAWFDYVGLGWFDPAGVFQANPYGRLLRAFPKIFSKSRKLSSEDFMKKLSEACPELDGGEIFRQANRDWKITDKNCSLGLSHALIELHEDEIVRLDCPADAQGWSLKEADPPRDGDSFKDDRFVSVEWRKK